jgi:hypothetical protein
MASVSVIGFYRTGGSHLYLVSPAEPSPANKNEHDFYPRLSPETSLAGGPLFPKKHLSRPLQ